MGKIKSRKIDLKGQNEQDKLVNGQLFGRNLFPQFFGGHGYLVLDRLYGQSEFLGDFRVRLFFKPAHDEDLPAPWGKIVHKGVYQ